MADILVERLEPLEIQLAVSALDRKVPQCRFSSMSSVARATTRLPRAFSQQMDGVDSAIVFGTWDEAWNELPSVETDSATAVTVGESLTSAILSSSSEGSAQSSIAAAMSSLQITDADLLELAVDLGSVASESVSYWNQEYQEWQDSVAPDPCDSLCIPSGSLRVSQLRSSSRSSSSGTVSFDGIGTVMFVAAADVSGYFDFYGRAARAIVGTFTGTPTSPPSWENSSQGHMQQDASFRAQMRTAAGTSDWKSIVKVGARALRRANMAVAVIETALVSAAAGAF